MEDEGAWLHVRGEGKKGVGREMERHIARERHFASHRKLRRVRDSHLRFAGAGEKYWWNLRVRGCTSVDAGVSLDADVGPSGLAAFGTGVLKNLCRKHKERN